MKRRPPQRVLSAKTLNAILEDPNEASKSNDNKISNTLYDRFGKEESIWFLVDVWFDDSTELTRDTKAKSYERELRKEKYVQYLKYMMDGQKYYIG